MQCVLKCLSTKARSDFEVLRYFYLLPPMQVSSWGGYVFLINLIPIHVLALMVTGRFSHRIYVAYCTVRSCCKVLAWWERNSTVF